MPIYKNTSPNVARSRDEWTLSLPPERLNEGESRGNMFSELIDLGVFVEPDLAPPMSRIGSPKISPLKWYPYEIL
jgi:hypothetical protein